MKKSGRSISKKGLQKKIEHLIRDYLIKTRNNGVCELGGCGKVATQADHCFSRLIRQIAFTPSNLTAVCAGHNRAKKLNPLVQIAVEKHVCMREGTREFKRLQRIRFANKPFPKWNDWTWLEGQLKKAEALHAKM